MEAVAGRPVSCRAGPKIIPKEKPRSAVQVDLARTYGVSQATISRLAAPTPFAESVAVAQ
jgi:hypothetical protein